MKKILLTVAFTLLLLACKAQYISVGKPKYKIVHQDTINIRGILLDYLNKPVPYQTIYSKNKEIVFDGYPIYTATDSSGKFQLTGALVKDTLSFYWGKDTSIINNGSRYLEIHLPKLSNTIKIDGVEVTAQRTIKKKSTPTFKVITNAQIYDYFGVTGHFSVQPEYIGGLKHFSDYVNSTVKYPQKAIDNNIEGEVVIGFIIKRDGSPVNCKILRGIGYGCDEEVIRVIKKSPKWKPAISDGRPNVFQSSVLSILS